MIRGIVIALLGASALWAAPAVAQTGCLPGFPITGCEPEPEPPPPEEDPPPPASPPADSSTPEDEPPPPEGEPPPPGEPAPEPAPTDPPCDVVRPAGRGVFMGLVSEQVYVAGDAARRCALSAQARAGVRILRQPLRWSEIETAPGSYAFAYFDRYVLAMAEHGIQVMPILFDPPSFRSARPPGDTQRGVYPPRRYADMGRFAAVLVRRYGPKGSLWRENPSRAKLAIRHWQVWNEPNFPHYWLPRVNAREYVALQRIVATAIRRVDRRANVITAGLPQSASPDAVPLTKYVKQMYKAGARRTFDTLAINAYARNAKELIRRVKSVRKIMRRKRDGRTKIWVTEIGWATGGPRSRFTVSEGRQARLIGQSFDAVARKRRKLGISGLVYYNWQDSRPYAGFHDFWGLHTGLLDIDGNPKRSLTVYSLRGHKLRKAR